MWKWTKVAVEKNKFIDEKLIVFILSNSFAFERMDEKIMKNILNMHLREKRNIWDH